jgi:hypothetical protein
LRWHISMPKRNTQLFLVVVVALVIVTVAGVSWALWPSSLRQL